jgi:hypothetical protein
MAGLALARFFDIPNRHLLAIASPVPSLALAHSIPARFMLPVIIAAAQDQLALVPDNLGAQLKLGRDQALAHHASEQTGVPNVSHLAREESPRFAPIGIVVVQDLALGIVATSNTGLLAPARIVFHAIRWVRTIRCGFAPASSRATVPASVELPHMIR